MGELLQGTGRIKIIIITITVLRCCSGSESGHQFHQGLWPVMARLVSVSGRGGLKNMGGNAAVLKALSGLRGGPDQSGQ